LQFFTFEKDFNVRYEAVQRAGQWSVLSVSLSCPTVCLFAFEIVYYWTNKDGWMKL